MCAHSGLKTSAMILENQLLLLIKGISKQSEIDHSTVRKIIHMWKAFKIAPKFPRSGNHSKFTSLDNESTGPKLTGEMLKLAYVCKVASEQTTTRFWNNVL